MVALCESNTAPTDYKPGALNSGFHAKTALIRLLIPATTCNQELRRRYAAVHTGNQSN